MFDSRQFLQFLVDRKLGFDFRRDLHFDHRRELLFDYTRNLSFDIDRALGFGDYGPVFRGRACPSCKYLVDPLEDKCRACGTRLTPLHRPPTKKAPKKGRHRAPKAKGSMVCPNCALKIPGDSVYCPRCRVKIDEWRQYLQDLRRWEQEVQRSAYPSAPRQPPNRYQDNQWQNVRVRRR
jgi:RNA polymerase subunit RPABC4/transcription elongation factor Spt4